MLRPALLFKPSLIFKQITSFIPILTHKLKPAALSRRPLSSNTNINIVPSLPSTVRMVHSMAAQQDSPISPPSLPPPPMAFIDIGANLLDDMYQGKYNEGKVYHPSDLDMVLYRAWDAGVDKIIITAGNLDEARAALELARTHERLFCTVGVHPTRVGEFESYPEGPEAYMAALAEIIVDGARDGKVVAVGECGLDYDRLHFCDAETQKKWFQAQFALAKASKLPMFLHLRAATADFMEIIHQHVDDFPAGGVVHSFDGDHEELAAVLAVSKLRIGLNGCSLKTEENLKVAASVPLSRLLIETDAPWCEIRPSHAAAVHVRTKRDAKDRKKHDPSCLVKGRNEPCNIVQVLEAVAGARGEADVQSLAKQVHANTEALFFPSQLCR